MLVFLFLVMSDRHLKYTRTTGEESERLRCQTHNKFYTCRAHNYQIFVREYVKDV